MTKKALIISIIVMVVIAAAILAFKRHVASNHAPSLSASPHAGSGIPRLIDLGAGKCIPCKMMAPILEELKREYQGVLEVEFIDVWKNPAEGRRHGIRLIPTQVFYDASGKEFFRHEGFFGKRDILDTFQRSGIVLKKPGSPK